MYGRRFLPNGVLACLLFCSSFSLAFGQGTHPVNDAPGFQQHRDYFSEMPFEHIDTLTGSLVLTFTDLVLPGDAGRELKFQRTYNSKGGNAWTFGIPGIPLRISNPAPPIDPQDPQDGTPALLMSDGSQRKLAWNAVGYNTAISSDFWIFDRTGTTRRLKIPNGDVCDYENSVDQYSLRVLSCSDAFGNQLSFDWQLSPPQPQLVITQHVGADMNRTGFSRGFFLREDGAHGKKRSVLTGVPGTRGTPGAGTFKGSPVAVGDDALGRRETRLHD